MRNVFTTVAIALLLSASSSRGAFAKPKADADKSKAAASDGAPKPEDLLRKVADYVCGLQAFSCRIDFRIDLVAKGNETHHAMLMSARLQRPNRFALVTDEGEMGMTVICDGKQLVLYMPILKRYTVTEAPPTLEKLKESNDATTTAMLSSLPIPTNGDALYKSLMDGVTKAEYVGVEKVGETECHHCRFLSENMDWEIWIATGKEPLVYKVVPDMGKQLAGSDAKAGDMKMTYVATFSDWKIDPKFTDADFSFTPPADASKVDSLFDGGEEQDEGPHPLLGQPAPPFKTVDLDEQPFDLKKHLSKDVIMLDFWATWCGPCVAALPQIDAVAKKYADKGVVFRAVNSGEDAATIKEFLTANKLTPAVAMDTDDAISRLYHVEGIPQTVLIGKDGKVQVVHVGFSENIGEHLSKQIDDLLAGKDLAGPELKKHEETRKNRVATNVEPVGVKNVWSVDGSWSGVAVDAKNNVVYAVGPSSNAIAIDADGKIKQQIKIDGGGTLRLGNLAGDVTPELIVHRGWGPDVRAFSTTGDVLWTYTEGQGVDDVWPADLNGDGMDEVIVGYNGGTGLHALDQRGHALWKFENIGNVWHVTVGDFNSDGQPDVVTTSAAGQVHVFDTSGKKLKDIPVSIYANMIRLARLGKDNDVAIVAGSGDQGEALIAIDKDGNEKWNVELAAGKSAHLDDLAIAPNIAWAAAAMRGGAVHVIDLDGGRMIAQTAGQGLMPQVAWLPRKDKSPLLIVATGKAVNAIEITPTEVKAAAQQAAATGEGSPAAKDNQPPATDQPSK